MKSQENLSKMGLEGFEGLSSPTFRGMRQRVSVPGLCQRSGDLLMDEPFGSLDEQNKIILQQELLKIWEETRKQQYILHSIDEALLLGDRVIVMTTIPGKVKSVIE